MIKYQELQWQEARKEIRPLNPKLCEVIDAISPDRDHTLYKIRYRFGDEILKKAALYLPTIDNTLVGLDSPHISNKLKEDLGYNWGSNPVGLLLKNSNLDQKNQRILMTTGKYSKNFRIILILVKPGE